MAGRIAAKGGRRTASSSMSFRAGLVGTLETFDFDCWELESGGIGMGKVPFSCSSLQLLGYEAAASGWC